MRIYEGDFTVRHILNDCLEFDQSNLEKIPGKPPSEPKVNLNKLNQRLNLIPVAEVRSRRRRMDLFYSEVTTASHPVRGVSFDTLLGILVQYNVLKDRAGLGYDSASHLSPLPISSKYLRLIIDYKNRCDCELACRGSTKSAYGSE
jgi:hypothetical protein